jgi:hypothetical protein
MSIDFFGLLLAVVGTLLGLLVVLRYRQPFDTSASEPPAEGSGAALAARPENPVSVPAPRTARPTVGRPLLVLLGVLGFVVYWMLRRRAP